MYMVLQIFRFFDLGVVLNALIAYTMLHIHKHTSGITKVSYLAQRHIICLNLCDLGEDNPLKQRDPMYLMYIALSLNIDVPIRHGRQT